MNLTSSVIIQDDSPFDYLEIRDFQRRISELQKANLNLKMSLIEQENRMSKVMADGNVNQSVIDDFIRNTKLFNDLNSQIRDLNFELDEAKTTISELHTKEEIQKEEKKQLQNEINFLKTRNQIYESNDQTPESSNSSKTVISLKLEISKLKQDIASQDAKNAELTVEILNLQSKLNDYENEEIRNESEVSRVRNLLNETQSNLITANEVNIQLKTEIESLNQQILEKNEKIKKKSKKVRAFKQIIQNNQNEIQICIARFKKRANLYQSQIDELVQSSNEKVKNIKNHCEKIQKYIVDKAKIVLNNSYKKYQAKIERQSNIIHDLAKLSAKVVNILPSSIPKVDDFINDESALELFVGRIITAHEMLEQSLKNKPKDEVKRDQKKNELSSKVANYINNLQSTLNDMTRTLHRDHLQLMDALTMNYSDVSD